MFIDIIHIIHLVLRGMFSIMVYLIIKQKVLTIGFKNTKIDVTWKKNKTPTYAYYTLKVELCITENLNNDIL